MQQPVGVQLAGVVGSRARLTLSIGGVQTSVTSTNPALALTWPEAVSRFAVDLDDHDRPDIQLTSRWGVAPSPADGRLLFDSGGLWQLEGNDRQLRFRFASPITLRTCNASRLASS